MEQDWQWQQWILLSFRADHRQIFLDVGGGASPKTVEAGFRIILKDRAVKAILINIFGGIVRCDRVAMVLLRHIKQSGQ